MANQKQLDILKRKVEQWNEWREQHQEIQTDLSGADLHGANLYEANLSKTNLSGANLSKTYMYEANLREANLCGANLSEANLTLAYLQRANLRNANLSEADLSLARLSGTDLSGAKLFYTIFAQVDLRDTRGLAQIEHEGPSHVTLNTIQLPQDGSSLHFLRGAGVSEEWINFYRSIKMHPIQYHSLFISYSSKDDILAHRLHADLQDHGVRCWFAPKDMKIGDKIRTRIDEAIHLQDKLLLLLSEHSLASAWVEDEVEAALEKERRQQRELLFPVRLDESVMQTTQAWAAKLSRTRHIGDFTHWTEPQAYQQALERLLRDLKAGNETKGKTDG